MADWKFPADYKYSTSDEWIKVEGDEALIGISDYAQDQLSDLVYVELPEIGDSFDKGETFGVVESVKAAADVKMPAGGEVMAVNDALDDTPEIINEDAFGNGWIIKIKLADASELGDLLDASAYQAQCEARS